MQVFTRVGTPVESRSGPACDEPRALPLDSARALLRTIEAEIIPRLMLAHRPPGNDEVATSAEPTGDEQVAELTDLVLHRDTLAALSYVQARRSAGVSIEHVYLRLLAPVAERLGEMWSADDCDFTQVTVGLWRLQQLVHAHSPAFLAEADAPHLVRRVMLTAAPGTQHTFGLLLVGEFFRRAGWRVDGDPTMSLNDMLALVSLERFDVIGVTVGSECHLDAVSSAILALRQASREPEVVVMVGGPLTADYPDLVQRVGADATASDAAAAVSLAEQLVTRRAAAA